MYAPDPYASCPLINFQEVNNTNLFVLGGGELIDAKNLYLTYPWAHKIKVPKIVLGCGVNAENPKQIRGCVVRELEQFQYIGVRDLKSLELLQSFHSLKGKVHLFPDLALAIDPTPYAMRVDCDFAVVVPTDRCSGVQDRGVLTVDAAVKSGLWLRRQLRGFKRVCFVPFGREDNDDFATAKTLVNRVCGGYVLTPDCVGVPSVLGLLSQARLVVAYRLHGLVLGYSVGARCIYFPYHRKLHRMFFTLSKFKPCKLRRVQAKEFENALWEAGVVV